MSLYSEMFMEYAKNPPNRGRIEDATVAHFEENRSCGDSLEVFLRLSPDEAIEDFAFEGHTAIVTTACTSLMGEAIIGMNADEVLGMRYEDIRAIIGFDVSPRRKQASVLGLLAVRNAIHKHRADGVTDDFSDVME